jgi:hypothetical protein
LPTTPQAPQPPRRRHDSLIQEDVSLHDRDLGGFGPDSRIDRICHDQGCT